MKPKRHPIEQTHQSPLRLAEVAPRAPAEDLMKCVWSGYPAYERDCRSRIPAGVVVRAWQRERQLKGTEEGFFYFSWRSGVWLAFGVKDGNVRGVYCPTHCSERDARETSTAAIQGDATGTIQGDATGTIQGDATGTIQGDATGTIQGDAARTTQAEAPGETHSASVPDGPAGGALQ
jgi:hypothetical protein